MIRPRRCPAKERGVTEGKGMLERLGNVLYWLCTGVAAVANVWFWLKADLQSP